MTLKTFTKNEMLKWDACDDPAWDIPEDWSGNALDFLKMDNVPARDRLWVVLRDAVLDEKTRMLFAVWCAKSVEHLMLSDRAKNAIRVGERYAHGQASIEELKAASLAFERGGDVSAALANVQDMVEAAIRSGLDAVAVTSAEWTARGVASGYAYHAADSAAKTNKGMEVYAAHDVQVGQLIKMLEEVA